MLTNILQFFQVLQEKLNSVAEHKLGLQNRLSKTMEENEDLHFQVFFKRIRWNWTSYGFFFLLAGR